MRVLLALLVAFAMTAAAAPEPCPPDPPASPEVTTPATGVSVSGNGSEGIYYIDNDLCQFDCLFSVWVYEETNGIPGLQRGDIVCDCTCWEPPSDTIIL